MWGTGDWAPDGYVMRSRDEQPVRVRGSQSMDETSCSSAITGQPLVIKGSKKKNKKGGYSSQAAGCYIMPMEYSATSEDPVVRPSHPLPGIQRLLTWSVHPEELGLSTS